MSFAAVMSFLTTYGPTIIAAASAATAALPQGKPGTAWGTARQILNVFALNFGNAKNAPAGYIPPPGSHQ